MLVNRLRPQRGPTVAMCAKLNKLKMCLSYLFVMFLYLCVVHCLTASQVRKVSSVVLFSICSGSPCSSLDLSFKQLVKSLHLMANCCCSPYIWSQSWRTDVPFDIKCHWTKSHKIPDRQAGNTNRKLGRLSLTLITPSLYKHMLNFILSFWYIAAITECCNAAILDGIVCMGLHLYSACLVSWTNQCFTLKVTFTHIHTQWQPQRVWVCVVSLSLFPLIQMGFRCACPEG